MRKAGPRIPATLEDNGMEKLRKNLTILKEKAPPGHTPSGTVYRQGGAPIPSLGVFEHWDSPETMRYSRNLDPAHGTGIEFIYIPMGSAAQ